MKIKGLNGQDLHATWHDGAEAYNGICVTGFPNLFMMYGPNTNLSHSSLVYMLEAQANYIVQAIQTMIGQGLRFVNVKADRQAEYDVKVQKRLDRSIWNSGCNSWYKTATGKNTSVWPGYTFSYRLMTNLFDPQDYELQPASTSTEASSVRAKG